MENHVASSIQKVEITVDWPLGFHLRPVSRFVKYARQFRSAIRIRKGKLCADGKNVLGLLLLAASWKSKLQIEAEGIDSAQAIEGIKTFFQASQAENPPPKD